MKNNSRLLILEYLYSAQIPSLNQMTLVLLGKNHTDGLSDALLNKDQAFIYHAKGVRVFSKAYPLAELSKTIIDMILEMKEEMRFSYQDFTYAIEDPYYRRDIRKMQFSNCILKPIFDLESKIIGVSIFYLDEDIKAEIDDRRLSKLIKDLISDENISLKQAFSEQLIENINPYWAIYQDDDVILSPSFEAIFKKNIIRLNEWANYLNQNAKVELIKTWNYLERDVRIYQIVKEEKTSDRVYALDLINQHGFVEFTILTLHYRGWDDLNFNQLLAYCNTLEEKLASKPLYYKYNNELIILVFNKHINKRVLDNLKNKSGDFKINYLRSEKDFSPKYDLLEIVNYIISEEVEVFNQKDYLAYRMKQSEFQFLKDQVLNNRFTITKYEIINSKDKNKVMGQYLEMNSALLKQTKEWIQFSQTKLLQEIISNDYLKPFVKINIEGLSYRKTWNLLKKINDCHKELTIILVNTDIGVKLLIEYLNRFKQLGINVFVDQSIFGVYRFTKCLPLYDGIIIEQDDLNAGEYLKINIEYYIEHQKQVLILTDSKLYLHDDIYYLSRNN